MMWRLLSSPCRLYSSFLYLRWYYSHAHTLYRCICSPYLKWWVNAHIDLIRSFFLLLCYGTQLFKTICLFWYCRPSLSKEVFLGWFYHLSPHVQVSHFCIPWFFKVSLDKVLCDARQRLQETLFDWLEETWYSCTEKLCM